jgi:hypothetical protein
MSLTYTQIEALLLDGVAFSSQQREFLAKQADGSDVVTITEMSAFVHVSLPLEFIVDRAEATELGSRIEDLAALRKLLGEIAVRAM